MWAFFKSVFWLYPQTVYYPALKSAGSKPTWSGGCAPQACSAGVVQSSDGSLGTAHCCATDNCNKVSWKANMYVLKWVMQDGHIAHIIILLQTAFVSAVVTFLFPFINRPRNPLRLLAHWPGSPPLERFSLRYSDLDHPFISECNTARLQKTIKKQSPIKVSLCSIYSSRECHHFWVPSANAIRLV